VDSSFTQLQIMSAICHLGLQWTSIGYSFK